MFSEIMELLEKASLVTGFRNKAETIAGSEVERMSPDGWGMSDIKMAAGRRGKRHGR